MSKENNDALEQEKENAQVIENDEALKDQESTDQELEGQKSEEELKDAESEEEPKDAESGDNGSETMEEKDTESKDENAKQTESAKDGESDTEKPAGAPKLLIAEIIIAVVAIGFIIYALVISNRGNDSVSDNNAASGNSTSNNAAGTLPGSDTAGIDNSILYEDIPAVPDIAELNQMTEEEAKAAVADNTMLQFTTSDGATLYLGNYNNQEYFLAETSVSENDIDEFITESILPDFGEMTETDHTTVSQNDVVSANFVGKLDGVAFDGGSAENVEITVGAGGYIPGFEDGFIGMSVGETKDVPVTFPEDYGNAELAGKDVVFTFTVNEILGTMTYPEELTDEIVQQIFYDGSCTTVAECRDLIKEIMTENNVWTFITENYYITSVPEETVYQYYNAEMASQEQQAAQYGMSVADLLPLMGQTVEDLKQSTIMNASYTAVLCTVCDTIASENGIAVTDEDIAAFAVEYGYPDVETLLSMIDEKTVRDYLLQENVLEYLMTLVQ